MLRISGMIPMFTAAEKRPVDFNELDNLAREVGIAIIASCLTCMSGVRCDLHRIAPRRAPVRAAAPEPAPGAETPEPERPEAGQRWADKVWCGRCRRSPEAMPGTWHAAHAEVRCVYETEFWRARGTWPAFAARHGAAVKSLIDAVGREDAIAAIRSAFSDQFWAGKATILSIAKDPDRHLGQVRVRSSSTRQQAPEGGRTWKRTEGVEA